MPFALIGLVTYFDHNILKNRNIPFISNKIRGGRAGPLMKKMVVVLDADQKQCNALCSLLADNNYQTKPMSMLSELEQQLEQNDCKAAIVNLDNISVTNKNFKALKHKKPAMSIIALSERQFHPELEESLREYISVCLAKPIDSDELLFWLKGIFENDKNL